MESIWAWEIEWIIALQQVEGLTLPMNLITFTGSTEFFLLILPALYWLVNRRLGVRMAAALLISIWVGSVLKIALHGPRPYWVTPEVQLLSGPEATFGLPSLHTLNATVMWPLLAHALQKWWAWAVAILLAFLAGVARVYLGVHFPSDVIVGWLLGVVLLLGWWRWHAPFAHWFGEKPGVQQILLGGILSIVFILVGSAAQLFSGLTIGHLMVWPEAMSIRAEEYFSAFALTDVVTVAGFTLGLISGVLICERRGGFEERAPLWQQILCYLIGVIGVLVLWQGLDLLFAALAPEASTVGYALRYIRYALIGLWIFGLAPLFFIRRQPTEQPALS